MIGAGYSIVTADKPKQIIQSKSFQDLLEEYLPDDMLMNALAEDIKSKKGNRKGEIELAFKVKGKLGKADEGGSVGNTYNTFVQNNQINPNAPKAKELAAETLKILMEKTKRTPVIEPIDKAW